MNRQICLDGQWEFRQGGKGPRRIANWLPATVPGTVHTDLLANGKIDDPFYRTNELDLQWVEYADWAYRRQFKLAASFLREAAAVWLDFEGLDTFATIRLNGKKLGKTDNMFHPWRFEVTKILRVGANVLEVQFDSAARIAEARHKKATGVPFSCFFEPRVHIRKSQCSGGWDWGPRLLTCGVWRPVQLKAVPKAEICNVQAVTTEVSNKVASLSVHVEIESHVNAPSSVAVELTCPKTGRVFTKSLNRRFKKGVNKLQTELVVDDPALWWPSGMGDPALHDLRVTLEVDGLPADKYEERVGLRTVKLIREKDAQGESFRFAINGRDVFCKGANWIPADTFATRVTSQRYRDLLSDAREANMNMIRVWGGGYYEDPEFYRTCDQMGLMVWQDFMFACAHYPENKAMLDNVRREAEQVVRALRNHPSIVLWNGCNENQWLNLIVEPEKHKDPLPGAKIYDKILPAVCKKLDPSRAYWPGSPTGGPEPNSPDFGNQHVWAIWGWWKKPEEYRNWPARFVSEFGFQAMPSAKTIRSYTTAADRKLCSRVLDHHNKVPDGHARIMKYLADSYGVPRDLDSCVYLSQLQQAEAIKIGVEHWRRRWPASAGAIYWQLNDCWPVTSWSAIDYHRRPKALWYASKRFFSPLLASFHPVNDEPLGLTDLELWANNDTQETQPVKLEVTALTLQGKRLKRRVIDARLQPGSSRRIARLEPGSLGLSCPESELVHVRMLSGSKVLSCNTYYFAPAKYADWPDPKIRTRVRADEGRFEVEVTTRHFARGVCLEADRWEGRFSDNFFDVMPGQSYKVTWVPTGSLPQVQAFRKALAVRSMASVAG